MGTIVHPAEEPIVIALHQLQKNVKQLSLERKGITFGCTA
jgi:hypothetical protein